tara:strand:- start:47 stop:607 length:561 start_codon:yes stop_codon:yes gene_type:complete
MNVDYKELINQAHEYKKGKVCTTCKEHKLLSEFYKNKNHNDGLEYQCRFCKKEYDDNICSFKKWFTNKKGQAKLKGIELTILPTDITGVKIEKYNLCVNGSRTTWRATEYPKVCSKWGIELDWGRNGIQYNSPSLDRIDPTKGYVPGNVRLVSNSYNSAKLNCPPDEWDVLEKTIARSILFGVKND